MERAVPASCRRALAAVPGRGDVLWYTRSRTRTRAMPTTLFDKIWEAHLVARRMDGRELIYIDRHLLHELHAPHAFEKLHEASRAVRRPDLTFSCQDHTVASKPG